MSAKHILYPYLSQITSSTHFSLYYNGVGYHKR